MKSRQRLCFVVSARLYFIFFKELLTAGVAVAERARGVLRLCEGRSEGRKGGVRAHLSDNCPEKKEPQRTPRRKAVEVKGCFQRSLHTRSNWNGLMYKWLVLLGRSNK